MTPDALRAAVAAAPDDESLRRLIRDCAERLRGPNDDDHPGLAATLVPLAAHASEKVRRALAEACDAFPDPFFENAHAALADDLDHYVCVAARRAAERRAERRKTTRRTDAGDEVVAKLAAELEAVGKGARPLARRLAKREAEQFLVRMEHEVRKADRAIDGALDAIAAQADRPDPDARALRKGVAALRERLDFQRSILRGAREALRHRPPSFDVENVASLVGEARAQLVARLGARAARLDFALDVPASLTMHADAKALLQALQNVLQNAVESYGEDAPRLAVHVAVRTLRRDTAVEIRVADRGAGMTEKARADLFVPFRSHKAGGTGVGLVVVRDMIEDVHGGAVAIESAPGAGTTVILTLPARQAGVRGRA